MKKSRVLAGLSLVAGLAVLASGVSAQDMIANRKAFMKSVGGAAQIVGHRDTVVVGLIGGNGVAPRKAFAAQAAARRLLPLRLGRQPVAVGSPVHYRLDLARLIDGHSIQVVITGRAPLQLRPRIAPLYRVEPGN